MRKISLFCLLLCCFFIVWCGQNLGENDSVYEWNLIVSWVWPELSFEPTIQEWTLVLRWSFEDHSDHIFLHQWIWERYFSNSFDYLPWTIVKFKWVVEAIDWAAWNHYYTVKSVDKLMLFKYPDAGEIREIFDGYNYCESDDDCKYIMWECPLWCYFPINKKFIDVAHSMVMNFIDNSEERCIYGCVVMNEAICRNYKCEMIDSKIEEVSVPVLCTPEAKNADICTMIYSPVCGSDFRTYWNSCVACQSDTVESYTLWECESSAFTIEWDSVYLRDVLSILWKSWAVTCDLFYADYDRQVHSFFMANEDRFYSAVDDYSDDLQRNVVYTLAVGGKIYNWDTFNGSEISVIDYPADIESEIASILDDKSRYPDFDMNCYEWIDVANEHLFTILSE